jgi:uncharacterized protein YjbI with pentapeptide repeats
LTDETVLVGTVDMAYLTDSNRESYRRENSFLFWNIEPLDTENAPLYRFVVNNLDDSNLDDSNLDDSNLDDSNLDDSNSTESE